MIVGTYQVSICPPDLVGEVVDGESIGPGQVVATDGGNDSPERVWISIHAYRGTKLSLKMRTMI